VKTHRIESIQEAPEYKIKYEFFLQRAKAGNFTEMQTGKWLHNIFLTTSNNVAMIIGHSKM
jgi:hypothetical protein